MSPRAKVLSLMFGFALPYVVFVMYFALQLPNRPLPTWFPYFGAAYLFGTILIVAVAAPRLSRGTTPVQQNINQLPSQNAAQGALVLVLFWCGLFIYGAYRTMRGDVPLERAIPAGAILLAAIGLFSWLLVRNGGSQRRSG